MTGTENLDATAPILIGLISSWLVFVFDQPLAVVMTAGGGALWAVWRHGQMKVWQAIAWIIAATFTACAMVSFVAWLLALLGATGVPIRGLAGLIAFVIIDKVWREKALTFLGVRIERVGK
jgi:hypothetical protein